MSGSIWRVLVFVFDLWRFHLNNCIKLHSAGRPRIHAKMQHMPHCLRDFIWGRNHDTRTEHTHIHTLVSTHLPCVPTEPRKSLSVDCAIWCYSSYLVYSQIFVDILIWCGFFIAVLKCVCSVVCIDHYAVQLACCCVCICVLFPVCVTSTSTTRAKYPNLFAVRTSVARYAYICYSENT